LGTLLAAPAAMATASAMDVCTEFLLNHIDEKKWMEACINAMEEEAALRQAAGGSQRASGPGELSLFNDPDVNMSELGGNQLEVSIVVDPKDSDRQFAFSNGERDDTISGLFAAYSIDGGETWFHVDPTDGFIADAYDSLTRACCDPTATWDEFDNLWIAYLDDFLNPAIVVAVSTDGGMSFVEVDGFGSNADQPSIASGPGSVWLTYAQFSATLEKIRVVGAKVNDHNDYDPFGTVCEIEDSIDVQASADGNFGDIAIGPNGQVLVAYQLPQTGIGPADIFVSLDNDPDPTTCFFPNSELAAHTNVGAFKPLPAQPNRGITAGADLAWDRSPGGSGQAYLVYTDHAGDPDNEAYDTDIYFTIPIGFGPIGSGPTWLLNDDFTAYSQFMPSIAVDQKSGEIAVSWHDARNDRGQGQSGEFPEDWDGKPNTNAQLFVTYSGDGGSSFLPERQVSTGSSHEKGAEPPEGDRSDLDYGDYASLAFVDGNIYPAWADNSNSTLNNPDGLIHRMDVYTARAFADTDTDNDAVPDSRDNCLQVRNGPGDGQDQCDTDGDGYGNTCDGDFNQDNIVGIPDFGTLIQTFGDTGHPVNATDLNCDEIVGIPDFGTFSGLFGNSPGPSGLSCAGTTPCP
jgi:hypothetical protein